MRHLIYSAEGSLVQHLISIWHYPRKKWFLEDVLKKPKKNDESALKTVKRKSTDVAEGFLCSDQSGAMTRSTCFSG